MIKKIALLMTAILMMTFSLPLPVQAASGFSVSAKVSPKSVPVTKYMISGQVTLSGKGLGGVKIKTTTTASGLTIPNVFTGSDGKFAIKNLPAGNEYDVTPAKAGFSFTPGDFSVSSLTSNQTANFDATQLFENISGTVSGLNGTIIDVRFGPNVGQFVTTASDGSFAINHLPENKSWMVMPVNPRGDKFVFSPKALFIPVGNGDKTDANFNTLWSISGVVTAGTTPVKEVEIDAVYGSVSRMVFTNSTGDFSFKDIPTGASVTLSAKKYGYSFATTFTNPIAISDANVTGQDFNATVLPRPNSIGGTVTLNGTSTPLPNVRLKLQYNGETIFTTMSASDGTYLFSKLVAADGYVVTPEKDHFTFNPTSSPDENLSGGSQTGVNFSATHVFELKGRIFNLPKGTTSVNFNIGIIPGTLTLTPVHVGPGGGYVIPDLPTGGTYEVEPSLTGHTVIPTKYDFNTDASTTVVVRDFLVAP